jgi:hypothetical protein
MTQIDINNKKAIAAIREAYRAGKLNRSQVEFLLSGVKV